MALADKLHAGPAKKAGGRAAYDIWIESLNETDREHVEAALADPAWSHVELLDVLRSEGAPDLADKTFGDWRRKHVAR